MTVRLFARAPVFLLALGVAALGGCSKSGESGSPQLNKVSGAVTRGGKPLAPPPGGRLTVIFVKSDDPNVSYPADVPESGGKYSLSGAPAGTYKVAVEVLDAQGRDQLGGLFGPDRTGIQKDVSRQPEQTIDIDVR